jgi:phosphoribosylformylglycinamidine cyclo-ligase
VLNKVGAFASISDFSALKLTDPVIVTKTEEPGSKQLLAFEFDMYESICFDMINHLVNDCIMVGAYPLIVQDCIVCGKLERDKVKRMVKAMADACRSNDCRLVGGETSEQPGVIPAGTYILSSSIVGMVDRLNIIDGSAIKEGDVVIAISSNGPHTNGYTLIRAILKEHPELRSDQKFMQSIMNPHSAYYRMAHITGGGIAENLDRALPSNMDALIDLSQIKILDVFKKIKWTGGVPYSDMLRTFNLGVGVTVVVSPEKTERVINHLSNFYDTYPIGVITKGCKKVVFENSLNW